MLCMYKFDVCGPTDITGLLHYNSENTVCYLNDIFIIPRVYKKLQLIMSTFEGWTD